MSKSIRPLTASGFAGGVSGMDLSYLITREQVAEIDVGINMACSSFTASGSRSQRDIRRMGKWQ
jgi:hypothetical protein